jgi:hypothetical protein
MCESGVERCTTAPCRIHADCWPNACIQNLCARAPRQSGSDCEPLSWERLEDLDPDEEDDAYFSLDGCACEPNGAFDEPWANGHPCWSFPCTPAGCYVEKCTGDGSCKFGLCSRH